MKKTLLFVLFAFAATIVSCIKDGKGTQQGIQDSKKDLNSSKEERVSSDFKYALITEKDYAEASAFEKSLYDKINAASLALFSLDDSTYEAVISVSKNDNDNFSNFIVISKDIDSDRVQEGSNSCTVCGFGSGVSCLKKIALTNKDEFDVHVKKEGNCFKLTW